MLKMIVDEAHGVGLGLGKEKWKPVEALFVNTLICGRSRFLVVEEDLGFVEGRIFWKRCIEECTAGCTWA